MVALGMGLTLVWGQLLALAPRFGATFIIFETALPLNGDRHALNQYFVLWTKEQIIWL